MGKHRRFCELSFVESEVRMARKDPINRDEFKTIGSAQNTWMKIWILGVPVVAHQVKNPASICGDADSIPGLAQWLKVSCVAVSCSVGHGLGSDVLLLWLRTRPAATARIGPLAWELPYAAGVGLKKKEKKIWILTLRCVDVL